MAKFQVYENEVGEWRWRLLASNGEKVLPPEAHTREADAIRAIDDAETAWADARLNSIEVLPYEGEPAEDISGAPETDEERAEDADIAEAIEDQA